MKLSRFTMISYAIAAGLFLFVIGCLIYGLATFGQ